MHPRVFPICLFREKPFFAIFYILTLCECVWPHAHINMTIFTSKLQHEYMLVLWLYYACSYIVASSCSVCNTAQLRVVRRDKAVNVHYTKIKISYMSCLPKQNISYTYLAEDRVEFYVNEGNV